MHRHALGILIFVLILLPSGLVAWATRDMPQFGRLGDDGIYWVSALSLAEGHGYRILSLPEQPYQAKYPPLYPYVLSLLWNINPRFPDNLPVAALFSWMMLVLAVLLTRSFYRHLGLGWWQGWLLCALLAANLNVVYFSIQIMPELLFCSLLLLSIRLADSASQPNAGNASLATAAGLAGAAAYLVKAAALPLLLSGPLLFVIRRQYRNAAAFFAAMLPFVAAWFFWARAHIPHSGDDILLYYTDYFGYRSYNMSWLDLPILLPGNLDTLLLGIGQLLVSPGAPSGLGWALPRLASLVAIAGVFRLAMAHKLSHYHIFSAAFVPMLLIWHYPPGARFMLPLLPLLLAGFYTELCNTATAVARWFRNPGIARLAVAIAVLVTLTTTVVLAIESTYGAPLPRLVRLADEQRQELANTREAYTWIARNVPQSAAFVACLDPLFYMYTGRRASSMPMPPRYMYRNDLKAMEARYRSVARFAESRGIKYLFTTQSDFSMEFYPQQARAVTSRLVANRSLFRPVYLTRGAAVYRIEWSPN